ncbi:MAG: hypothetical protein QOD95_2240 [Gammaproteobacteria bacterium]|jgi:hypothetical protein|nr:hypothetical protein [Gammaproteobacteria bacterium]
MSNGRDPNKTPPPPPAPPSGPGGIKPQDVDKPPQSQLRKAAGAGGTVGRALIG